MSKALSQSQLGRHVETFIENGRHPRILAVLETVGCGAAFLDEGEVLLRTWQGHLNQAYVLEGKQNEATEAQNAAHKAAQLEIGRLTKRVRFLFAKNRPLLNQLGLRPQKSSTGRPAETNGDQTEADLDPAAANHLEAETDNGSTPVDGSMTSDPNEADNAAEPPGNGGRRAGRRRSQALGADISRWRRLCINSAALTEAQQVQLAEAGWPRSRVEAAAGLVEAVAGADNAQQLWAQAKQDQFALAHNTETQLREWYRQATRRAKMAIDEQPPEEQPGLRRSLSL